MTAWSEWLAERGVFADTELVTHLPIESRADLLLLATQYGITYEDVVAVLYVCLVDRHGAPPLPRETRLHEDPELRAELCTWLQRMYGAKEDARPN